MIRLLGQLGIYLILLQLLLITWGKRTKLHRLNGKLAYIMILSHGLGMLYINGIGLLKFGPFLLAFLALLIFTLTVLTSIWISKLKLKYETWFYIHLANYLAIILASFHHPKTQFLKFAYLFVFANVFYFKFLKLVLNFWKHKFRVDKIVQETPSTVSVYITGTEVEKFSFEPGQYVVIRFLDKNFCWQAHPFSFSSLPGHKSLRLTIKNSGDFTKLLNTKHLALNTYVVLDGPYGDFTAQKSSNDKILLLAGGVGVTPLRTLIETFTKLKKDVVMVYAARSKDEIIFQKELMKYKVKYVMGHLEEVMLKKLVPDLSLREVYICGPEGFNKSMKQYSQEFGVKSIHLEEFST